MDGRNGILSSVEMDRQKELIKRNVQWLRQANNLLQNIDDTTYVARCTELQSLSVASHMPRLLDLYSSFVAGLATGRVDYNTAGGQPELTRRAAIDGVSAAIFHLQGCLQVPGDNTLWIRSRSHGRRPPLQPLMASSITRELDYLSSQAANELALISLRVQLLGTARYAQAA